MWRHEEILSTPPSNNYVQNPVLSPPSLAQPGKNLQQEGPCEHPRQVPPITVPSPVVTPIHSEPRTKSSPRVLSLSPPLLHLPSALQPSMVPLTADSLAPWCLQVAVPFPWNVLPAAPFVLLQPHPTETCLEILPNLFSLSALR